MGMKTSSDLLKDFMAAHPQIGGNASDWKRLSKKKDGEGHWVRAFENAKTKARVEVVELSPTEFVVAGESATIEKPAGPAVSYFPIMNTDAEKERIAQTIMDDLYATELNTYSEETTERVKSAGVALANKFYFCYCSRDASDDDVPYWFITPILDWDRDDAAYTSNEVPLHALLPGAAEDLNGCGTWYLQPHLKPLDGALELMKRGFIWNEKLQMISDEAQSSLIKRIAAGRQAEAAALSVATAQTPSNPAP